MSDLFFTGSARRTSGAFTVTMKNGDKLAKQLAKLEKGGETALQKTVNDFTSRAPAWVSKGIREHYGVDTAAINEAGPKKKKGASHISVAGVSVAGASLEYKGRTLTPTHFKMSPKSRPTTQQAKQIRVPGQAIATILKGSRASMSPGTFVAAGNGGSVLPFQRTAEGRTPIEAVRTLSVPQMISGRAKDTIEELIAANLEKRFEHYIQQAMK